MTRNPLLALLDALPMHSVGAADKLRSSFEGRVTGIALVHGDELTGAYFAVIRLEPPTPPGRRRPSRIGGGLAHRNGHPSDDDAA